jgi:hypothetical protein
MKSMTRTSHMFSFFLFLLDFTFDVFFFLFFFYFMSINQNKSSGAHTDYGTLHLNLCIMMTSLEYIFGPCCRSFFFLTKTCE